ncbi:reverse transcriptase domain-containing protein [Tanacetum coccineum]
MKDLVANKPRTKEDKEIRMKPRCSALLQNQLPPKEQDPGSFILPCSIGRLDFNNALADLGASISIMPLSMYKRLGIGKLEPINMVIEMDDNTKYTPKGIVENLLIKIDKFIFPIDFVILDIVEDFRMPIILGRPLLATTYAKITRERILKDHWREKFRDKDDDIKENSKDPEECREDKANTIMGDIHDKLNDDWFKGTSEDKDNMEGILDYLKPRSYDGFIDLDNEAYNKRRWIEEMPRTRDNVASIRVRLMEKMANVGNGQAKTFSQQGIGI